MYAFCHEALADYVDSFETYANYKESTNSNSHKHLILDFTAD